MVELEFVKHIGPWDFVLIWFQAMILLMIFDKQLLRNSLAKLRAVGMAFPNDRNQHIFREYWSSTERVCIAFLVKALLLLACYLLVMIVRFGI